METPNPGPPSAEATALDRRDPRQRGAGLSPEALLTAGFHRPDALRERILSFVTHEMRNPLASALWASEMLARRPTDAARVERLGQLALRSVRRLRGLFEDYFALERMPAQATPGRADVREAMERALGPHDLEPQGLEAAISGERGLVTPLDPALLDRLLHSCARRLARAQGGGPFQVAIQPQDGQIVVALRRNGIDARSLDPAPLTPGGSEGEGTTFTLMVARLAALRLGVPFSVAEVAEGTEIRLLLPLER